MSNKKIIVVTDYSFANVDPEQEVAKNFDADFFAYQCVSNKDAIKALTGVDLAFIQLAPIPKEAIFAMNKGALIVRYGVGLDNLPLDACKEHGVKVCNVPDYGKTEVADHTVSMLLALHRRLPQLDQQVRNNDWDAEEFLANVQPLDTLTLGVFGCGRIGQQVLQRMQGFDVQAIVYDPTLSSDDIEKLDAKAVTAAQLWKKADLITLHAPSLDATRGIINKSTIAKMKDGVIIVNCARGDLINEKDLAAALTSNKVGGAGLDVFALEPMEIGSSLRNAPNILLSPHAAWCSARSIPRLQQLACEEGMRFFNDEPLRCEIKL